jgi:multiple antibiotic resistance protein
VLDRGGGNCKNYRAMKEAVFFIYAFTSIFVIVNPIGGLLTFLSLTEGMGPAERNAAAKRAVLIACILALVFALSGELILRLFSITVDNLRVVALDMLHAKTSRQRLTPEEMQDASEREDISVFPLATPMLTGPGAITTVIVVIRTGKTIEMKALTLLAILLTFAISYLLFRFADRASRALGVTASLVITRIMGLLLGAIAVNFVAVGIWNIYKSFS